MAYVSLKVGGLSGVTPIGCSITFGVGTIPVAHIDLAPAPPGVIKINPGIGAFSDIDAKKRKGEISVDVKVKTYAGNAGYTNRTLKFVGLLDGLSITNSVGGNTYQAVLKNKAQTLLELTTTTPGLYPMGVDIYKCADYSIQQTMQGDADKYQVSWTRVFSKIDKRGMTPVEFYTKALIELLKEQEAGAGTYLGVNNVLVAGTPPMKKIFEDPRYKKAASNGIKLLSSIDYSAINSGFIKNVLQGSVVAEDLQNVFVRGSNIVLENYMGFLAHIGCTLIFGNNKIFAVPQNSMLKQTYNVPSKGQLQTEINKAQPADYTSYTYSDNGFRDIGSVVLTSSVMKGGSYGPGLGIDPGIVECYVEPAGLSQASGVYTIPGHPWMLGAPQIALPGDSKELSVNMDSVGKPAIKDILTHDAAAANVQAAAKEVVEKKKETHKKLVDVVAKNYAETKFFQARYSDRHGSISMDFNPNWVPGTGGTLFIRETGLFIAFYVTSVTHTISMAAPNSGTAVTHISFSCGRMGKSPPGASEDKFLGYNLGLEKSIQQQFVKDIT